jgi:lipopolysaccharide transport system permease protein
MALWEYRELLYFLAWRDVKVRYKQTVLGALWAVLQPVMVMIVFSIFFGRLAGVPSDGVPYPVFTLCALVPWQLFAHAISESSNSLVVNEKLITKVYFPRVIVPLSAVLGSVVDFGLACVVLTGLFFVYGIVPGSGAWAIPFFLLLTLVAALGTGFWLSALNTQYRDVRYTLPFITQLWLFVSPVAYPASMVPEPWRWLYALNPMTGVIEGFRWALLGHSDFPGMPVFVSLGVATLVFVTGLIYFRWMEKSFADLV